MISNLLCLPHVQPIIERFASDGLYREIRMAAASGGFESHGS